MRTNAKVNLFLRVLRRRPDGYHDVETILHNVGFADDVDVASTPGRGVRIQMDASNGVHGVMPEADRNVIARAATLLADRRAGRGGISVRVMKRVPVGGGLGGGSANAAGALIALNELWRVGLDQTELTEIAAKVGSDVPFCVVGGTALATSRGENVSRLTTPHDMWFVLGLSREPLLTKDVYSAWDRVPHVSADEASPMTAALETGDVENVAEQLRNDLEPAVFTLRPELRDKKTVLVDAGALGACVAGSGPTVFALAADEPGAHAVADRAAHAFDRVVVAGSRSRCVEPVE